MPSLEFVTLKGKLGAIVVDYTDADTHPDEQIVTGFCDIFPRLPEGKTLWCPTLTPPRGLQLAPMRTRFDSNDGQLRTIVAQDTHERQTFTLLGSPSGGAFAPTFRLNESDTPVPTALLPFTATASQMQTALQALPQIGFDNVYVTGNQGGPYNVMFANALGASNIPTLGYINNLTVTSGPAPTISVTTVRDGEARLGVELLACNEALPLDELIYDLVFSEVRFNGGPQYIEPFAIKTLTHAGTIDLTDPDLVRLPALDGLKALPTPS